MTKKSIARVASMAVVGLISFNASADLVCEEIVFPINSPTIIPCEDDNSTLRGEAGINPNQLIGVRLIDGDFAVVQGFTDSGSPIGGCAAIDHDPGQIQFVVDTTGCSTAEGLGVRVHI